MTGHGMGKRERISFQSQESALMFGEEEFVDSEIEISIDSIENIIRSTNLLIKIIIEHNGIVLRESKIIKINSSFESLTKVYPIDFSAAITYLPDDMAHIAPLVSTPVLIKVLEVTRSNATPSASFDSKAKEKLQRKSQQSITSKDEVKVLGMCNVDLLPVILGEVTCREKLLLEVPSYNWERNIASWANLPRISVTISRDENELILKDDFNIFSITVESIYNLPLSFTEDKHYKCGTVLHPDDHDIEDSAIIYDAGKWTDFREVELSKTWRPLQHLESRARFSRYKINCDCDCVKNDFKQQFDFREAVKRDDKRIEWNTVDRTLLEFEDVERIKHHLQKYKNWPFIIVVEKKPNETSGSDTSQVNPAQRDSMQSNEIESPPEIYQVYVDASQLLYPGRTKARVLAQLHTQSPWEMRDKTGLYTSIFSAENSGEETSKNLIDSVSEGSGEESQEHIPSDPVFTENKEPVLILIEFELQRPFIEARVIEDFTEAFELLKRRPKEKGSLYAYTPDLAHEQYMNCIKSLVDIIAESFRDFTEQCGCANEDVILPKKTSSKPKKKEENVCKFMNDDNSSFHDSITCPYAYIQDDVSRFRQFLHESGIYVSIRRTLKNKIINLMDQKFPLNSSDSWYSTENQHFVATCYSYLVEQMHIAVNEKVDVRLDYLHTTENYKGLWYYTEELHELGNYEKADKLTTKIVTIDLKNPDLWIIYAIHTMKTSNVDQATESCRKAIELNSRHKIGLLFYGILLAMREEYEDSEIFLKALTFFYPRFAEGWAVLHLLYVKIQYYPGIDVALEFAEKSLKDKVREGLSMDILKEEPMVWSTALCRSDRIFLVTTTLLLKLNLYDFAELALTQEYCRRERTVEFLYFLSVKNYLQGRYETVLEYLNEASIIIGIDYSVTSLMGHTQYKMGHMDMALVHYKNVDMLYDRPEDIHLIHVRMGSYYNETKAYDRARNVFLRACKNGPTCISWLGVGISSYHLENFEESELALAEANRLDGEDPEVWGYLCLLSMSLHRYDEFAQCYRQTVKNNLRSDKLWRLITDSMDALGYSSPIDDVFEENDRCIC